LRVVTTTSPGPGSSADNACANATVAFSTTATFRAEHPTSDATSPYAPSIRPAASSAASYPPSRISRSRWSTTMACTDTGISAAPALFRWIRPASDAGVSRRHRSISIPSLLSGPSAAQSPRRALATRSPPRTRFTAGNVPPTRPHGDRQVRSARLPAPAPPTGALAMDRSPPYPTNNDYR
jgi:hypothetical protein